MNWDIVEGNWKLIHNVVPATGAAEFELYDRGRDPLDGVNVATGHPDIVARLGAALEDWRTKTVAVKLTSDKDAAAELSPEELERLKSLGYIQ